MIGAAKTGRKPQITYSSVVTVQPIAKSMTVKLLFPLEHATCTCHKKEFLRPQGGGSAVVQAGIRTVGYPGFRNRQRAQRQTMIWEQVHEAASQMRTVLEELSIRACPEQQMM